MKRSVTSPHDARSVAAATLLNVFRAGALAAAELDQQLQRLPLMDRRDRALATELVYGVLRTQHALDQRLSALVRRPWTSVDPRIQIVLRVAAYQLLFLDRVPPFAVVNEAVTAAQAYAGRQVGGFVNAVLRKLTPQRGSLSLADAIAANVPEWLREQMVLAVGEEQMCWLLGAQPAPSTLEPRTDDGPRADVTPTGVRLRAGAPTPSWYADGQPGLLCSRVRRFLRAGELKATAEYAAGHIVIQEEGAVVCGLALGARPGERVLDACAGTGQKATLLAEEVGHDGELWATDKVDKKLVRLRSEFVRLGLPTPRTLVVDWTEPQEQLPRAYFDRILVDAACSGTGTLRRRPEISMRVNQTDVERMALQSEQLLRTLHAHLAPGGRLLFVVCSVLGRECEEVLRRVEDLYAPEVMDVDLPLLQGRCQVRLLPGVHGTDGFFIGHLKARRLPS